MKKKYYSKGLLIIFILALTHLNGQTLKSLADAKGKYIGNLMRDGFFNDHQINNGAIDLIAKTEYNTLVVGNKMKMSNLLKNRPVDPFNVQVSDINTADIDRFVAYANANGMRKRGHVMIWYKQIPQWL
jgi:endo-1,4-beta-xylanase